jgi:TPR repeat protein
MLWQLAATAKDAALLGIYLDRYPQGAHAEEAEELLKVAALDGSADQAIRSLDPDQSDAIEEQLWDLARQLRARPLVEIYLDQHPQGGHADEARRLLALLSRAEEADAAPGPLCRRLATHPHDATANVAGVPLSELARHAELAIETCRKAAELQPELPHFTALQARALSAAGRTSEAVALYRSAAERGDLRAMVSLGLISETGDGAPRDLELAYSLYERAAEGGSPDGAINLAVALVQGVSIEHDIARAGNLLRTASESGSAIATYNLGVLAQKGLVGDKAAALELFTRAADQGEPQAYRAAAVLLDEGRGIPQDHAAAARMLLRGVAADHGESMIELTSKSREWSRETIKAVQVELQRAGFYDGAIDGISGPLLRKALENWRSGGFLQAPPRQ